jgi:hypothetical protein
MIPTTSQTLATLLSTVILAQKGLSVFPPTSTNKMRERLLT